MKFCLTTRDFIFLFSIIIIYIKTTITVFINFIERRKKTTTRFSLLIIIMAESSNDSIVHPSNPFTEIVRGQPFEVGPRYVNLKYIGEGAYGMVV